MISLFDFLALISLNVWVKATAYIFPVFQPNDYFFANHQKEGEEKWQTYARVMREIMLENSNMKDSDLHIEDKYAYKRLIYPDRKATD